MARAIRAIRAVRANANDLGMTTAEYCIGTVAAVALAGVLYEVISGSWVKTLIQGVISHALNLIPGL
ncbi:MAG TPA: DUF4244 domain-containing protein [Mycobacteriales bacterium]|jgi:hypothetical protein|nr:DUF4244 domain-containing protein [Mycobacteriales bacterium]